MTPRSCTERYNVFVQASTELFQDCPEPVPSYDPLSSDLMIRRERQTFTRLEKTDAVLFTVRTYMQPLVEWGVADAARVAKPL